MKPIYAQAQRLDPWPEHAHDCQLMLATRTGVECQHGYDVCPQCDPCTCALPATVVYQIDVDSPVPEVVEIG